MRYALHMADGTIGEMQVLPKAVRFEDGREFRLPHYKVENGKTIMRGESDTQSIVIEAATETIKPDSVPGAKVIFYDPREIIAKWPAEKRAKVVQIDPL